MQLVEKAYKKWLKDEKKYIEISEQGDTQGLDLLIEQGE